MAKQVKNPQTGSTHDKGFGPAANAGQATTVQVNPNSTVGTTGNSGNKK